MSYGFKTDNPNGNIYHQDVPLERSFVVEESLATEPTRNVYPSLALAAAAISLAKGARILDLPEGDFTWPVGTFDFQDVTIRGISNRTNLTFPDGVVFSRLPKAILEVGDLEFDVQAPVYSGDGEGVDITFDVNLIYAVSGSVVPFVFIGSTYRPSLRFTGDSYPYGDEVAVFRLEDSAFVYVYLEDRSSLDGPAYPNGFWPFEDDGSFPTIRLARTGTCTVFNPNDIPNDGVYPPAEGRVGVFGAINDYNITTQPDQQNGPGSSETISPGYLPSPDPEHLIAQWVHPATPRFLLLQEGRIFPTGGLAGNALSVDGILTGTALNTSAVVTSLPAVNITAIRAAQTTAAAINAEVGWITVPIGTRRAQMRAWVWFSNPSITGLRFFAGLTDGVADRADNTASGNPAGLNMIGIQLDTGRGDTRYQFMCQDGATQELVSNLNSSLNVNFLWAIEIITLRGASSNNTAFIKLYRVSTTGLVAYGAYNFTASVPGQDVEMALCLSVQSLDGAAKTVGTFGAQLCIGPF